MIKTNLHSKYFRISVTDKCNLNCYFCHKEGQSNSSINNSLSADDIIWAAGEAIKLGFTKFKITGGEPTLRKDLPEIIIGIKRRGAKDISLITNGTRLAVLSSKLKESGLDRINVSIYSLNPFIFVENCNGSKEILGTILEGIDKAINEGFENIKLNFVLNNSNRSQDLYNIIQFAKTKRLKLLILPLLNFNLRPDDQIYSYDDLYKFVKTLGVVSEEFLTDTEGFRQRFIHTKTGAGILLRMDHLFDKKPYKACLNCQYKHDCLEGILPLRLSNHGLLLPCLSKGVPEINMRAIIENRSESEFKKIINEIGGK